MEELLFTTLEGFPLIALVGIAALSLYILGKGADILVDEAVALSVKWGIPKMIIGATIVSLGTT
ncbi:MAG: sodium:calcium antiporter, partial [Spirochaetales bacterium]|nr:sodium:calcium antiporter [Spirochaetales bacterium]